MLTTFENAVAAIEKGTLLHISGTEALLRDLPRGNWIGGSTEYFLDESGGKTTGELLDVRELPFSDYKFAAYDVDALPGITKDAYANGFSIIILPFDSAVHKAYAQDATGYEDIFLTPVVGWISGLNLDKSGQTPVAVNGQSGEITADKAIVLHIGVPEDKTVLLNIINIFSVDESSPEITFSTDGFSVDTCFVDGKETVLADYIAQHSIDTKLPLVGSYGGAGVNVSIKAIADGTVSLYAPVFSGITYKFAEPIEDYEAAFNSSIAQIDNKSSAFACNCILNYLYGALEGKDAGGFYGPITFGEIAWQLLNQTLVYLQII
ncbi:MAG: hypothetical protein LBM18_05920 [Oscillospiraceae bacterium]|jgi:hypothetical protein|nr:hypothetical protein [Oscillospiraceae bacterium]